MKLLVITIAGVLTLGTMARAEDAAVVEQFIAEKLDGVADFSDEQRGKIRGLFHEELDGLQKLAQQYTAAHRELLESVRDVSVDEKAIRARADKIANVLVEYAKKRAALAKQIKGVLTADQSDKAPDALAKIAGFVDEVAKRLAAE